MRGPIIATLMLSASLAQAQTITDGSDTALSGGDKAVVMTLLSGQITDPSTAEVTAIKSLSPRVYCLDVKTKEPKDDYSISRTVYIDAGQNLIFYESNDIFLPSIADKEAAAKYVATVKHLQECRSK